MARRDAWHRLIGFTGIGIPSNDVGKAQAVKKGTSDMQSDAGRAADPLSSKEFWDKHWKIEDKGHADSYIFDRVMRNYLPIGGTYFEVGCAPGTTMAYFNRNFGYQVSGIDFSSTNLVHDTMARYHISDYCVVDGDFLAYSAPDRYDVVGSFGFVEHFKDYVTVIRLQARLVRSGGYMVIEVPNLRFFNWLLYRIFLPETLKMHNLAAMDPDRLLAAARCEGDFRPLYCSYHGTCFLHFDAQNPLLSRRPWLRRAVALARTALDRVGFGNIPSRYFSPYILMIARRDS